MRLLTLTPIILALAATACGHKIGDSCSTNVDCSPAGERICDTAQVDGYCTVEGCDVASCPDDATCVRFFPTSFLSQACDPLSEDAVDPRLTPTNSCTAGEICLTGGFCANRTSERRFCMQSCSSDGDCRGGYECRSTGTRGAEALVDPENPGRQQNRFCAPRL